MNERIKQLAEQARVYAVKQNETTSIPYSQAYSEKFSELMAALAVSAVAESEWFYCNANTNQKTQAYVAKTFRS
jgi:hypothetical protein